MTRDVQSPNGQGLAHSVLAGLVTDSRVIPGEARMK